MKKKIILVFTVLLAIFLVGCPNAPSNNVPEEEASSLKASGATLVPTSESDIIDVFTSVDMDDDPLIVDLKYFFGSFGNGSEEGEEEETSRRAISIGKKAFSAAKDLGKSLKEKDLAESLKEQITLIQEHLEAFPEKMNLDEEINVTGEAIGTYLTFTKGEATLKANANTTDGGPIVEDYDGNSNLQELSGEASLKIEINPIKALYNSGSAIKDLRFKTNTTGNAKIIMPESDENPPVITLNYTESLSIGLSFSKNEKGGKFILTENAKHSGDIDAAALNLEGDSSTLVNILVPEITITLKVYDDNNQVKFSKTYNSIEEFTTAFFPEEPIE